MDFQSWYTDTMDVLRVVGETEGNLTKHRREQIFTGIPCRIYKNTLPPITMKETAAETRSDNRLMCSVDIDLHTGDELMVHRGALVGGAGSERYFVGEMQDYYEPFGAVIPGLAHKEVNIMSRKRVGP